MDSQHLERLVEVEQRSKSNTKRLDEHDTRLDSLEKTYSIMEKMDYRMGKVEESTSNINKKIDALQAKSNESVNQKAIKWDKLIDYLFYAILAYALFKLGLK